jgi:hypothetical protein
MSIVKVEVLKGFSHVFSETLLMDNKSSQGHNEESGENSPSKKICFTLLDGDPLPHDIVKEIMMYLDFRDLLKCMRTSKKWYQCARQLSVVRDRDYTGDFHINSIVISNTISIRCGRSVPRDFHFGCQPDIISIVDTIYLILKIFGC